MPRHLGDLRVLVALAFTATALMTVLLPSKAASADTDGSQEAVKQEAAPDELAERVAPEPRGRPVVVAIPSSTPTDAPPETLAPVTITVAAPIAAPPPPAVTAPPPAACPATFFCYARLGISGPIVPYDDCSGATDVGAAIRRLTCVRSGIWLAGHAYTSFGGITGYRVGDVVFVLGQRFEITGATVQRSCEPVAAMAPLSLQTSLEPATCGRVLVVQGR